MTNSIGAKNVPQIAWVYFDTYKYMDDFPCMQTINDMRTKQHIELCKYYNLTREETLSITDHMNKLEDAVDLHHALQRLQGKS
jgi:hypothetical protein